MKKNKSKSKNHSAGKKIKKELEAQLTVAFTTIADQFGKAKKANGTIEKFAKQLIKKIEFTTREVADTPEIVETTTTAKKIKPVATPVEREIKPVKKSKVTEEAK